MIPAIGVIISLYVITRYSEMFDKCNRVGKVWLVVASLITFCLMLTMLGRQPVNL